MILNANNNILRLLLDSNVTLDCIVFKVPILWINGVCCDTMDTRQYIYCFYIDRKVGMHVT